MSPVIGLSSTEIANPPSPHRIVQKDMTTNTHSQRNMRSITISGSNSVYHAAKPQKQNDAVETKKAVTHRATRQSSAAIVVGVGDVEGEYGLFIQRHGSR